MKSSALLKKHLVSTGSFFICTFFISQFLLSEEMNPFISKVEKRPNIIVILTDQERYPTHWPEGWAEKNLSANTRLRKHGLSFNHAYTAACECTPSRAVLTTSEHYPINKIPRTPPPHEGLPTAKELTDIGSLLKNHTDYEVVWKGKWHLSLALNGDRNWSEKDIANLKEKYNLDGWNPPDAGNALSEMIKNPDGTIFNGLSTLGGGYADNDSRYINGSSKSNPKETPGFGESVIDYLKKIGTTQPDSRKPFCLFISLVNPHDVWVYPADLQSAGYKKEDFTHMGMTLPSNYVDDLTTKPSVQLKVRNAYNKRSPLNGSTEEIEYVNFYAYLNKLVDSHIETILNVLDEQKLTEDTIIIRTADHGELGLSHGMREKAYTVYEEMIHVPFIVSNPKMFPFPISTEAFYCHLDLMPTIAEIAGVPNFSKYGKGISIVPVLKNPKVSVQDAVLFTFDDVFTLPANTPSGHIRGIRQGDWTYAVYYSENGSDFEYELYNLKTDPDQLKNLLYKNTSTEVAEQALRLHTKLKTLIDNAKALPSDFPWPTPTFIDRNKLV